ncbi:MAG: PDZ domain-containing protein [Gemmatimonas sp.]
MKSRVSVTGAAGVLLFAPFAVVAQGGGGSIRATPRTSNAAGGNMCLQLETGPSRLSSSPEGLTFIRMKAEVDAVERARRADSSQHRQIIIVQGRLDSLGQLLGGTGDPRANRFFFEMRQGSAVPADSQRMDPSDPMRMMVSAKLRELLPQVAELSRAGAPTVVGTLNIRLNTLGYVGLTATAGTFPMTVDPMLPFAYCDYPRVESVEVGSPADRAGLIAGDTLIAYNNRDLRQTNVNYPDLLIPGKNLLIKFRRDGQTFNKSMIVAARDQDRQSRLTSMGACTEAEAASGCISDRVVVRAGGVATGGSAYNRLRSSAPSPAAMPSGMLVRGAAAFDGMGGIRLAGASIITFDEQTAKNIGTEAGLFVFVSPENTQAYQQGLRSGDWVVSVNGTEARDVAGFKKAYDSKFSDRAVTLLVSSKTAGARTVVIQW